MEVFRKFWKTCKLNNHYVIVVYNIFFSPPLPPRALSTSDLVLAILVIHSVELCNILYLASFTFHNIYLIIIFNVNLFLLLLSVAVSHMLISSSFDEYLLWIKLPWILKFTSFCGHMLSFHLKWDFWINGDIRQIYVIFLNIHLAL